MEAAPTVVCEIGRDLRQQRVGDAHQRLAGEAREREQDDRARRVLCGEMGGEDGASTRMSR